MPERELPGMRGGLVASWWPFKGVEKLGGSVFNVMRELDSQMGYLSP